MIRLGFGVPLLSSVTLGALAPAAAWAQAKELAPVKIDLPPSPNFDAATAPVQYPTGELSVYGLRKGMSKYLDKDVRVKGVIVEVYECPEELRRCNEAAAAKAKREARQAKPPKPGAAPKKEAAPAPEAGASACRPCEQPHFYVGDSPTMKLERSLLVADYPVKDWKTSKPKPLAAKAGDPVVVTGTFAINSITGFAASNGLLVHKRTEDAQGKSIAEGNAVLPPEAQTIQLEGKPPEPLNLPAKH